MELCLLLYSALCGHGGKNGKRIAWARQQASVRRRDVVREKDIILYPFNASSLVVGQLEISKWFPLCVLFQNGLEVIVEEHEVSMLEPKQGNY